MDGHYTKSPSGFPMTLANATRVDSHGCSRRHSEAETRPCVRCPAQSPSSRRSALESARSALRPCASSTALTLQCCALGDFTTKSRRDGGGRAHSRACVTGRRDILAFDILNVNRTGKRSRIEVWLISRPVATAGEQASGPKMCLIRSFQRACLSLDTPPVCLSVSLPACTIAVLCVDPPTSKEYR